jgi:hypothetical protein
VWSQKRDDEPRFLCNANRGQKTCSDISQSDFSDPLEVRRTPL